jgi:hypothetical protein
MKTSKTHMILGQTKRLISLAALSLLSACQSVSAAPEPQAARLMAADETSLYNVKLVIEQSMGRKNIVFGATDWGQSSTISVLPVRSVSPNGAPFNQQQFELPTLFNLMMSGKNCYLVQRGTDIQIPLENVACTPLASVQ